MSLFDELMSLHARAAAEGEYEVAYHCLMAALHLADQQGDERALDEVDAAVKEVGATIESLAPEHQLSRSNAEKRGQPPLVESMVAHVQAVRARLRAERARGERLPSAG